MWYFYNLGTSFSCLLNALIGGKYNESLSLRIGRSILEGGLASEVLMPKFFYDHCIGVAERNKN